jgi:hypothetical protein
MLGLPELKLIQNCVTRWNSTYFMLESMVKNRNAVTTVLGDRQVTQLRIAKKLELSEEDWGLIQQLVPLLRPLHLATEVFCNTKNPVSVVRPVIISLIEKHLNGKLQVWIQVMGVQNHTQTNCFII